MMASTINTFTEMKRANRGNANRLYFGVEIDSTLMVLDAETKVDAVEEAKEKYGLPAKAVIQG